MSNNTINIDESSIYEGGAVSGITLQELKGNLVAIKQLMNNYNIAIRDIRNKDGRIATLESEIEFLKTTPFIGIVSLIANIVATVMISIAVNFLTTENTGSKTIYIIILIGGGILLLLGGALPIIYPYVRGFFNKKDRSIATNSIG